MSRIELKTIQHMKNQTISNLNEKRQLADDKAEITWMLDLSDKKVKAATIKMIQWAIMNMFEINETIESFSKKTVSLTKEIKI